MGIQHPSTALLSLAAASKPFNGFSAPTKFARSRYKAGVSLLREETSDQALQQYAGLWSLLRYYVGQKTEASCSLATTVMILNVINSLQGLTSVSEPLLTEENFFSYIPDHQWYHNTRSDGSGLTLKAYGKHLQRAFAGLGIDNAEIEVVYAEASAGDLLLAKFRHDLRACNPARLSFIVGNFQMGAVVDGLECGHISPIAAYDRQGARALVLDVDRSEVEPYWLKDSALLQAMSTIDPDSQTTRGYIKIKIPIEALNNFS